MVNVGIIGCGSIAKFRHAPEYFENAFAEIVGYYDPSKERALELSKNFGGKAYDDLETLLADKNIDAVSVCTANKYHAEITIKALIAGKHVLCEKPMATTLKDAAQMIEASEKCGKFLMVGHNQRLVDAHIKAKEILKSGRLGKVITFRTNLMHKGPETWSAQKGAKTWFFNKEESAMGAMGDLGIHKADLIRWLLDDEIEEVAGFVGTLAKKDTEGNLIGVDDNSICVLRTKKGSVGSLTTSWTNYGQEDNSTILYCTKGVISICASQKHPLTITTKDGNIEHVPAGGIQTNDSQTKSGVIDLFIGSIESGVKPEISGEEGLAALKIIFACFESSETGRKVSL